MRRCKYRVYLFCQNSLALQFFLINNQQIHKSVAIIYWQTCRIFWLSEMENSPGSKGWEKQERFNKHVTVQPLIFLAGLML